MNARRFSLVLLFCTCYGTVSTLIGTSQEMITGLANTTIGKIGQLLMSAPNQESLLDDDRDTRIAQASVAFGVDKKKIRVQWALEVLPYDHFLWGDTLFLNKAVWDASEDYEKTWMIWHEVAHFARNHSGLHQVCFASGAAACIYLLSNMHVTGKVAYGSKDLFTGSLSFLIPALTGTFFSYRTMLRCQEISAIRRAAEALCENGKRDVVESVYAQTMLYLIRSVYDRVAWCFPTWKEHATCLQSVLEKDDLHKRMARVLLSR